MARKSARRHGKSVLVIHTYRAGFDGLLLRLFFVLCKMNPKTAFNIVAEATIKRLQTIIVNANIHAYYGKHGDNLPMLRNAVNEKEALIEALDLISELLEVDYSPRLERELERFR